MTKKRQITLRPVFKTFQKLEIDPNIDSIVHNMKKLLSKQTDLNGNFSPVLRILTVGQ